METTTATCTHPSHQITTIHYPDIGRRERCNACGTDLGPAIDHERHGEIVNAMLTQIGRWNLAATSGGRVKIGPGPTTIRLPVAHGYSVEVEYVRGADLYTVRRVFTRAGRRFLHGEAERVFCEELAETVYRAGCYHDPF